jgi:hypothetical protein
MPINKKPPYFAFTLKSNGIPKEIISEIGISIPTNINIGTITGPKLEFKALWDTGATNSVITKETAKKLGLKPVTFTTVHHGGGNSVENVYNVSIFLPNHLVVPLVRVTECTETAGRFDAIIGMDIITAGDFSISHVGGKSTFTFRMPSVKEVDFIKELNDFRFSVQKPAHASEKINRNDPCPCGSGKPYKKCHGLLPKKEFPKHK